MNHISITTLEAPELDIYARLSEGQLFHYNEITAPRSAGRRYPAPALPGL